MSSKLTTLSLHGAFTMSPHIWPLIILRALYTLPYLRQTNHQTLCCNPLTTRRNPTHRILKAPCNKAKMPLFSYKMETRRLHNTDMRSLVRILRDVPAPTEERYERKLEKYQHYTKKDIQRLPGRLRCPRLSFGPKTNSCSTHKGLDQNLVNDIWAWVKHELEGGIGRFLYPLIMSGRLTAQQETKMRQLEPVLQMWLSDFDLDASAPPGHEPVRCGTRWSYQQDQCPACIMARIGSDEDVLFTLFAGMVGRFGTRTLTTVDTQRSTDFWDKTKSKRLRFVRYWVKKTNGGDTLLFEAGELGMHMKRVRLEWKQEQRRLQVSLDGTTVKGTPITADFRRSHESERPQTAQPAQDVRRSRPTSIHSPGPHQAYELPATSPHDPKLGPEPRSNNAKRLSPAEQLGFEMPGMRERVSAIPYDEQDIHPALRSPSGPIPERNSSNGSNGSKGSDDTIKPDDSVSVAALRPAPLRIVHHLHHPSSFTSTVHRTPSQTHKREDSVHSIQTSRSSRKPPPLPIRTTHAPSLASSYTLTSYVAGPSSQSQHATARYDPLDSPIYNALESPQDRAERYRMMLANPFLASGEDGEADSASIVLPEPKRQSMYGAFGSAVFDGGKFDGVDVEVPEEEEWERDDGLGEGKGVERESGVTGDWDDLY
jgi:hypothetical protein